MNKTELAALAKRYFIADDGLSTTHLIRRIQVAEGSFDCYGTPRVWTCKQFVCRWRRDCVLESVEVSNADPALQQQD